jgi:hypothetical protein
MDDYTTNPTTDEIMDEAQKRFKRCQEWEADSRKLFLEDQKFVNADSDNGWQWPSKMKQARDLEERPSLTINKTRQHCLQIINDAKQNKPGVAIRPCGGEATYEAAQMLAGIVRFIEYQSSASVAYDTATEHQVHGGIGYWRIVTDYVDDVTFDQDIFIREVQDPLKIFLDPDIRTKDGSDARFAFVFEDVPKDTFLELYPEYTEETLPRGTLGNDPMDQEDDKHVRVAEYWRKVEIKDKLVYYKADGAAEYQTILGSKLPKGALKMLKGDPGTVIRDVVRYEIEWYEVVGDKRREKKIWPGAYIPLVRVIGEETIVENKLDRKGHVRALKDPQRMYNYWTSAAVEHVALQSKTPYIAPVAAIEGFETYWETANSVNHSILPYNATDDSGNMMPAPQRQAPPQMAPAYLQGMQVAGQEMGMVSGQYDSQMGDKGNERTGKAINERQRQGDRATYHFIDNLAVAITFTGKILLDLIPKIYDTKRIVQILNADGTNVALTVDPNAQKALQQRADYDGKIVETIFNPNLGRYNVQADVGPQYGTKREQAFDSLVTLITQAPQLTNLIGDIMLRAADFPLADEAAERIKRMVPPEALGTGPTQREQQLTQQLQMMQAAMQELQRDNVLKTIQLKGKEEMRNIDAYDSETKRLDVLLKSTVPNPADTEQVFQHLVGEVAQTNLAPLVQANERSVTQVGQQAAPQGQGQAPPGAKQGSDGNWYLPHPTQPGKFMQLGAPAKEPANPSMGMPNG